MTFIPWVESLSRAAIQLEPGDWPTWISALASLGALGAAVFAGLAAWRVLQVERGRDDERRLAEERAQAELVAA